MNQTVQRRAILAKLRSLRSHPTADELHVELLEQLPQISLGTVYRNLEQLAAAGLALRLGGTGRQKRYDADTAPHCHRACPACGRLFDLPLGEAHAELHRLLGELAPKMQCESYRVEFLGRCRDCRPETRDVPKKKEGSYE